MRQGPRPGLLKVEHVDAGELGISIERDFTGEEKCPGHDERQRKTQAAQGEELDEPDECDSGQREADS